MPFAVIRKQRDGTRLYLQGPSENDFDEMMWTPRKDRALPFSTAEKADLIVRLMLLHASIELDVIGLKQEPEQS